MCELDIVFNFHKVYGILDEMIIGGEIMETSKSLVLGALRNLELLEWNKIYIWKGRLVFKNS